MATWLTDIKTAFANLGGVARYRDLYEELGRIRGRPLTRNDSATVRKEIERTSSDSANFQGRQDIFFSVEGLHSGVWGLRSASMPAPLANDFDADQLGPGEEQPPRVRLETFRIIRDTYLARQIKRLHRDECQLCGGTIVLADGARYSEAHHLRPLGGTHCGPDVAENVIVVCPTCHVKLDYFAISLSLESIRNLNLHAIAPTYIAYHNQQHEQLRTAALDPPTERRIS